MLQWMDFQDILNNVIFLLILSSVTSKTKGVRANVYIAFLNKIFSTTILRDIKLSSSTILYVHVKQIYYKVCCTLYLYI